MNILDDAQLGSVASNHQVMLTRSHKKVKKYINILNKKRNATRNCYVFKNRIVKVRHAILKYACRDFIQYTTHEISFIFVKKCMSF